ncbi:hypothetical protein CkaCkLH20_04944 [Colletotrichum karsti]|uniref:Uncharacterized protein n=1 Tax=Colletotrichum karsti TaxID=1095194 RepID=A0A9P6I8A4_9PEZI|nr:uncharacterized protein CkaCkLH20_04944 [Colletotrichum karsti]KAF9877809.1 hypothetical protein CkaCkLH20_04944 [Colletotrichum karsti]
MASLRGARYALASKWHQPVAGFSANPLHASLRPQLRNTARCLAQPRLGARNFSIAAIADAGVEQALAFLINGQVAGGGWVVPILTLSLVTSMMRLPLQKYSETILIRQASVSHYINLWQFFGKNAPQTAIRAARERRRILKEHKAQDWKTYAPFLGFPIWLVSSEAIRRLCGVQGGILSVLTGRYRDTAKATSEGATSISDQTTTTLVAATDDVSNGAQSLSTVLDLGVYTDTGRLIFDLAAPDPWFIGPAALGITMIITSLPSTAGMKRMVLDIPGTDMTQLPSHTKWKVRLSRAMLAASVVLPFAICQLPSGLFLYWVSSMWWTKLINQIRRSAGYDPDELVRKYTYKPGRHEDWLLRRTM